MFFLFDSNQQPQLLLYILPSLFFSFLAQFSYLSPNLFFSQWKNISPAFIGLKKSFIYSQIPPCSVTPILNGHSGYSRSDSFSSGWELYFQRAPSIPPGKHERRTSWYSEEKTGKQEQWAVGPALLLAPCLALIHTGSDGFYLNHEEICFRINNSLHHSICLYPNPWKL